MIICSNLASKECWQLINYTCETFFFRKKTDPSHREGGSSFVSLFKWSFINNSSVIQSSCERWNYWKEKNDRHIPLYHSPSRHAMTIRQQYSYKLTQLKYNMKDHAHGLSIMLISLYDCWTSVDDVCVVVFFLSLSDFMTISTDISSLIIHEVIVEENRRRRRGREMKTIDKAEWTPSFEKFSRVMRIVDQRSKEITWKKQISLTSLF